MKNTKTSWLTHNTTKPEGFRVMLKSRYKPNQRAEPPEHRSISQLTKNQQIDWNTAAGRGNFTEMKDYVRKRMKTECRQHPEPSRTSLPTPKPQGGIQSALGRYERKNPSVDEDKKCASMSVSRVVREPSSSPQKKGDTIRTVKPNE
jgi:hypothetical protein